MIEDKKTVKSIQAKSGGKSGTYWAVTWTDGKTDNIFNEGWVPLLEQSQNENRPVHFTKEQSKDGKFYNIKSLELVDIAVEAKPPQKEMQTGEAGESKPVIPGQERGLWWKEVGENFRAGLFKKDDKGAGTHLWVAYVKQMLTSLEIIMPNPAGRPSMTPAGEKEVQPAKSGLVEEAKKMGAVSPVIVQVERRAGEIDKEGGEP